MSTKLSSELVEKVFKQCLAPTSEDGEEVRGVVLKAAFDPAAIESHRDTITAMLNELPDQFKESGGGGWSFLNACNDRHGDQWTSFHRAMEMLFMLGKAAGLVTEMLPREMWDILPGGVPYYIIMM